MKSARSSRSIFVFAFLSLFAAAALAQPECPAPVIMQTSGSNPSCASQVITLDAGGGFTSYLWSNGATTRTITDAPTTTTTYSVTTTDANGCNASSVPYQVTVTAAPASPVLRLYPDAICAGAPGSASIDPPDPSNPSSNWQNVQWSIQNGTITNQSGAWMEFTTDPAGGAATITVTATDNQGCTSTATATTVVRTIPPPVLRLYPDAICAGAPGSASIDPPDPSYPYENWRTVTWSIQNGTITNQSGAWMEFTTNPAGGAATITVTATDNQGCTNTTTATTVVRTIPPPVLRLYPDAICAGAPGSASIDPPDPSNPWENWRTVTWSIQNGTITNQSGAWMEFITNPAGGAATITVTATDNRGCTNTATGTTVVRTIPPPVLRLYPDAICAGAPGSASIDPPDPSNPWENWRTVTWSIQNGTITNQSGAWMEFTTNPAGGAATITVTATDNRGCTNTTTGTTVVRAIPPPVLRIYPTPISPGGSGNASIDRPNPSDPYSNWTSVQWSISNGTITSQSGSYMDFTAGSAGEMTVTVTATDNMGCTTTASQTIALEAPAQLQIRMYDPTVCADGYGSAWIDPAPPEDPYTSIVWVVQNGTIQYGQGMTSMSFQADGTGNAVVLNVTAQTATGSSSGSVTVPTRTPVVPVIELGSGSCPTTATVTNASQFANFNWLIDGGEISGSLYGPSVTFHASGNGRVTVTVIATDLTGCQATATAAHDYTGLPDISYIGTVPSLCYGVQATASVPDGGPGVTYQWSTTTGQIVGSSTSRTVTFIPQSDTMALTITATNAGGCAASGTGYTMVNRPPVGGINVAPAWMCTNATATVSTYANATSYTWEVIGGEIVSGAGTSAIVLRAGSGPQVTVRVTKAQSGCAATYEHVINTSQATATITPSGPTTFCAGGSVTLTASTGTSYAWSNGATTQSITVGASGSYTVAVTNSDGCSATSAATAVTARSTPVAMLSVNPQACAGQERTANAVLAVDGTYDNQATFAWSITGGTITSTNGAQATITSSGGQVVLSVTGTDRYGCTASTSRTIDFSVPDVPTITAGGPTTFCEGGYVQLTASAGSSYHWSTGETTQSILAQETGTFTVTVGNAAGCEATSAPISVTMRPAPAIVWSSGGPVCAGVETSREIQPVAGATYAFSIVSGNAQITQIAGNRVYFIINSGIAEVGVTVTDANGCSAIGGMQFAALPAPVATISGAPSFCAGGSTTLTASAGASWLWSNGATTQSINVTSGGPYHVTVTGANGCSATSAPVDVTVNTPATPTISGTLSFCAGGSTALTASAGASWSWSNGATTQSINVTSPGPYHVTVTDANGCSAQSAPVTVTQNTPTTPTISGTLSFCAGGSTTLTASAGASYSWSNGATTQSINVTSGGQYHVTVTDANGCSAQSAPVTVTQNAPSTPTISGTLSFCAGGSTTLTASAGASYSWSNGATTPSISVTSAGQYHVTVTDANGCSAQSAPVTVTQNTPATPTISGALSFCAGGSTTLTASAGASYSWSNGATTPSINVTSAGPYHVTVTYANGCSAQSATVNVVQKARPTAAVTGNATICAGSSATISAALTGVAPFNVTWSDGVTQTVSTTTATRSVSPSATTTYTVTAVSDANCSGTASGSATITVNTLPSFAQPGNQTLPRNNNGVNLSVTPSGTAPFTYQWYKGSYPSTANPVATTQTYNTGKLAKGTHTFWVRVTNTCGSTSSTTITITVP
jgi:large repetitive protein